MRLITETLLGLLLFCWAISSAVPGDLKETFDNAEVGTAPGEGEWVVYDEESLGDRGPSSWTVISSPLDVIAMSQSSNIWGDVTDTIAIGSFVIYDRLWKHNLWLPSASD